MLVIVSKYNPLLVCLSITVAVFASFVALDLSNSVWRAKGGFRWVWLTFGAMAMGFGIWSMHFVGMLAFEMPGVPMSYDVPLMCLSILIAILASALALYIVSRTVVTAASVVSGGIAMAAAIAGMHYTGMYSMRMPAVIQWNLYLVSLSIFIALIASFAALLIAIRLRNNPHRGWQVLASLIMGVAISGMHYTGMVAATFIYSETAFAPSGHFLPSSGIAVTVLSTTALILGLALIGAAIDRAFGRRTKKVEETAKLYAEAEKAVQALQEERDLRERFVSALAHDLRTPLAAIRMGAQLSLRQSSQAEMVEGHSVKIIENMERMDQMIQDLLDAHRISADQSLPIRKEKCELSTLVRDIFENLTTVYGNRLAIGPLEEVHGEWDAKYLRRAIENLCTNAVKYGRDGTKVTLSIQRTRKENALVSVHNFGDEISEEEQQNLFGLFHRGDTARSGGKKGWGLGLTIVKGIAEAHGGEVKVRSSSSEGTTFSIDLPTA